MEMLSKELLWDTCYLNNNTEIPEEKVNPSKTIKSSLLNRNNILRGEQTDTKSEESKQMQ